MLYYIMCPRLDHLSKQKLELEELVESPNIFSLALSDFSYHLLHMDLDKILKNTIPYIVNT